MQDIMIFTGNSNRKLAEEIAECLGIRLGDSTITHFSDGECSVSINESVRGKDVFVVQSTCCPVNDNLMELLVMTDALRRASAKSITAVIPYYGYARQDRKAKSHDPISARLVADLIETAGINHMITMDLHATQIQGFFRIPVDVLSGAVLAVDMFKDINRDDWVVVSPDLGSVARSRKFAEYLQIPLAIVDKRRPKANVSEVMNVIGEVEGKNVLIIDDMVDTAGTLCNSAAAIKDLGANTIVAVATHGVLSGPAYDRIMHSYIDRVIVSESIPVKEEEKIEVMPTAKLFADAIRLTQENKSLSSLFI